MWIRICKVHFGRLPLKVWFREEKDDCHSASHSNRSICATKLWLQPVVQVEVSLRRKPHTSNLEEREGERNRIPESPRFRRLQEAFSGNFPRSRSHFNHLTFPHSSLPSSLFLPSSLSYRPLSLPTSLSATSESNVLIVANICKTAFSPHTKGEEPCPLLKGL